MKREPSVKKLKDGRFGLFVGEHLLGIARTEVRADIGLNILKAAFTDRWDDGYADGHIDGYDEGHSDAEMDRE